MRYGLIAILACSLLLPPAFAQAPAPKPSFDCAKAKSRVSKLICNSNELAALDVQEAALIRRARTAAATPDAVNAEEDDWRRDRDACPDVACIAEAYHGRIADLHRWVN